MAGLYIHIPFCTQKCIYCDFYSIVSNKYLEQYLDCVVEELKMRKKEIDTEIIRTIYIGGGTPSLIPKELLYSFICRIKQILSGNAKIEEFTIEVNPDDITRDFCNVFKETGINRVSMGVQSFNDTELEIIKRRHNSSEAENAYDIIKRSGIGNISIDLIYGLPQQNLSSWSKTLETAMRLHPNHISVYSLMYEKGTLLYRLKEEGKIKECSDEEYIQMDTLLQNILSDHGYLRYEISNYSLPGYESVHNSNYWYGTPYLGIGAGAHSYDGEIRSYNPNNVRSYINTIKSGKTFFVEEYESPNEIFDDYIMTHLRTVRGIEIKELESLFNKDFVDSFKLKSIKFIKGGAMSEENGYIHINNSSFMISDAIISELFAD